VLLLLASSPLVLGLVEPPESSEPVVQRQIQQQILVSSFHKDQPRSAGSAGTAIGASQPRNLTIGYLTAIKGGLKDRQGLAISGALTMALAEVGGGVVLNMESSSLMMRLDCPSIRRNVVPFSYRYIITRSFVTERSREQAVTATRDCCSIGCPEEREKPIVLSRVLYARSRSRGAYFILPVTREIRATRPLLLARRMTLLRRLCKMGRVLYGSFKRSIDTSRAVISSRFSG